MSKLLNLSSGPQTRDRWTTQFIMYVVAASLIPTAVVGVVVNGLHALWIILASVGTAVLSEFLFDKICKNGVTQHYGIVDGDHLDELEMLAHMFRAEVRRY